MTANEAFSRLIEDFANEAHHADLLWQTGIIVVCLLIGKLVERRVRAQQVEAEAKIAVQLGHGGLKRVIFPLVSLLLVAFATYVMTPHMQVNLLRLFQPLLASLAIIRSVFFVLRVTFRHSTWLINFERMFATVVWCAVVLHITGFLPELIAGMEAVPIPIGKQDLNLWQVLRGIFAVAVSLLLSLWLGSMIEARLVKNAGLEVNLQVVLARVSRAALLLVALMISLPSVGIDLTALSVFGGAIGVGLGFGLQKIASNYVSGFIILLDRSIKIGHTISVGNDKGQVTKITTRYTVLRSGNGIEALVPNEALVSNTVQNETYSDYRVRHTVTVQIGCADDPQQAMQLLIKLALEHPDIAKTPEPEAFFDAFGTSSLNLSLLFWIDRQVINAQKVRSDLNLAIWQAFAAAGISIPFPQQEVRLLK